jgi:excisionase family DNA binding protein
MRNGTPNLLAADLPRQASAKANLPRLPRVALTVDEAAATIGLSPRLTADLIRNGDLPAVRFGSRVVVPVDALRQRMNELAADATGGAA